MATPLVAQADEVSVYGRLHMSYGQVTEEAGGVTSVDNWQMRSHASRLGVKGSRDFGNGLSGTFKIEYEVNPDSDNVDAGDGTAGLSRRNQYVGLKGGFGELRFGRHDTPLKMAQGKFDQFGDTDADLKHAGSHDGENRIDNVLAFIGKSGSLGYAIAVAPGEDDGTGGTADTGPADTISVSVNYKAGPLYVAVAQDSYENGESLDSDSLTRLVATYKMGDMQLGLLYQSGVEKPAAATAEEDWIGLSFNMKAGTGKIKAQYIMVEDSATVATENTLMAVGYDHKFDKKTTGYVMYSSNESDTGGATSEETFLGAGMVLKF